MIKPSYYDSASALISAFETPISRAPSLYGAASWNNFYFDDAPPRSEYVSIRYRPLNDGGDPKFAECDVLYHSMQILVVLCRDKKPEEVSHGHQSNMLDALAIAGNYEKLCYTIGMNYVGHEEVFEWSPTDPEKKDNYYFLIEMKGYYRNTL